MVALGREMVTFLPLLRSWAAYCSAFSAATCMATCQVWRWATVPLACAGCVAAVAMAPLARRRSFCALFGPMSWASRAQADLVGRFPLAGVRVTPTRTWTEPGSVRALGGAAANRCRRGRPPLVMEATPVVIQCF